MTPKAMPMKVSVDDAVERIELAPGFSISRISTGLRLRPEDKRDGGRAEPELTSVVLDQYLEAGFTTFSMADHHPFSGVIAGRLHGRQEEGAEAQLLASWMPEPGQITFEAVRASVQRLLDGIGVERIDLLQFDAWSYADPAWLECLFWLQDLKEEGLIRHLGLKNFDTAHLRIAVTSGLDIVSNQVSYSLVDQRARAGMTDVCLKHDVKLLVFGTMVGGLLSERWLGAKRPELADLTTRAQAKYWRFIQAAGGWDAFQHVLECLKAVARRQKVSIGNVACRYMLDQPAVGALLMRATAGAKDHLEDKLKTFQVSLTKKNRRDIDNAVARLDPIPGDCGDEERRPPFLTATGEPSPGLATYPRAYETTRGADRRSMVLTGTAWEETAGFSRAVRRGNHVWISGTRANHRSRVIGANDPEAQAHFAVDKIEAAVRSLGGSLEDVVRTRVYIRDASTWEAVARVHGERFGHILPATTMVQAGLIGDAYLVEIEAEALVG